MKLTFRRIAAAALSAATLLTMTVSPAFAEGAKWTQETTLDGWVKVVNDGGATLGYSADSGVALLEQDGYAFKDLNKNGRLDAFEDWRLDISERAADLAGQLSAEEIVPLMFHNSLMTFADKLGEDDADLITKGERAAVSRMVTAGQTDMHTKYVNQIQALAESLNGIPFIVSTDPMSLANIPSNNLALAATFDPELVFKTAQVLSADYSADGAKLVMGPQIDISTDPRWDRIAGTFGEDPALDRDMAEASVSGLQSTFAEDGADLGWGEDSVLSVIKHFPGDGAGESGRESHNDFGKYAVYPGENFAAHLIAFFDGGLNLTDSSTEKAAAVMPSYSIAYTDDESLGELKGSNFSTWKLGLLRNNGYDELIISDWNIISREWWGVEDLPTSGMIATSWEAGTDQIGGAFDPENGMLAYDILVEDMGEEAALARVRDSARRIFTAMMKVGLFENPYVSAEAAKAAMNDAANAEFGNEVQQKSIVMLKNDGVISENTFGAEKPKAYVPMIWTSVSRNVNEWRLPVDEAVLSEYVDFVTDTVGEPTGAENDKGEKTYTTDDIIRATADELSDVDFALLFVSSPAKTRGYDNDSQSYYPIALQYGEYTADSDEVRTESISGNIIVEEVENPYSTVKVETKENRSYYGVSVPNVSNYSDLEAIRYAKANIPESAKIIVSIGADKPMIFSELEPAANAILINFDANNISKGNILKVISGEVEPSGLLPIQMPANMETVEGQLEDVPRDLEVYVDAAGNAYDFGYGLNWSGVISDERTAVYQVEPLTTPETIEFAYAD